MNKDNKKDEFLIKFLSFCEFWEAYSLKIVFCLILLSFLILSFIGFLKSIFLVILLSVFVGDLLYHIIAFFTVDRREDILIKSANFPILIKSIEISKEDEDANSMKDEPTIPGLDFFYDIKKESKYKYIVALQVDEENYKVISSFDCSCVGGNKKKKITSETLVEAFKGMKKEFVYTNQCLIINVVGLKSEIDIKDCDILNISNLNDDVIITEYVYYPYIS